MTKPISKRVDDGEYMEAWRQFKEEQPEVYTAAAILPGTGQVAAVADYVDAMKRGDTKDGVSAAASFIPGVKLAKLGSRVKPGMFDLAQSKRLAPNSVRTKIAPATVRASAIGKAAAAEQVGDYASKSKPEQAKGYDGGEDDYSDAWKSTP